MIKIGLIVLVCVMPVFGYAGGLAVRGGEHETFTRLTADVPSGTTWHLKQSGTGSVLFLDDHDVEFDLSRTFSRIGRDRVRAVSSDGNRLIISLGCQCEVVAFRAGPQLVAIDIRDQSEDETFEEIVQEKLLKNLPETVPLERLQQHQLADLWLNELMARMLRTEVTEQREGIVHFAVPNLVPLANKLEPADFISQIRVHDGSVPRALDGPSSTDQTELLNGCVEDEELGFLKVEVSDHFWDQLAELRREVFSVTGRVDARHAFELVEFYVALGFGEEAFYLSEIFRLEGRRSEIVRAMAAIVDEHSLEESIWTASENCGPTARFWSYLGRPEHAIETPDQEHIHSVLNIFSELEPHMQRITAKRLETLFIMWGQQDAAARIRSIAARTVTTGNRRLETYANTLEVTSESPFVLAEADRRAELEDILSVVAHRWANGLVVSRPHLELLESYRFERRGQRDEERVITALVRSSLLGGDFPSAQRYFNELSERGQKELADDFLDFMVQNAPDASFLISAQHLAFTNFPTSDEVVLRVITRVGSLGFSGLANTLAEISGLPAPFVEGTHGAKETASDISAKPSSPERFPAETDTITGQESEITLATAHEFLMRAEALRLKAGQLVEKSVYPARP